MGGGGGEQARDTCGSERRRSAVAMAARHLQPSVRGTQLHTSSDSRPAAAGDAQPPSGFPGVRGAGTHEEEVCSSANLRAGRKGGRPLSAAAGRGWRGRGPVEDAHVPSRCAAEGPPAARRSPHIRVPGDTQLLLRRPSPPRGTNTKLPAAATPLPSDGSYLRPPWVRLRGGRSSSGPRAARLTRPEDEDGRHALCVSRSFHSGRDS